MVGKVEPRNEKLNFRLDGNFRPRDSHLTGNHVIDSLRGFAAGCRKMSSTDVRWMFVDRIPVGVVREHDL